MSDNFRIGLETLYDLWLMDDYEVNLAGITTTIEQDDISFLPLSANLRFQVSQHFMIGGNAGYALAMGDQDGGF